MNVAVLSPTPDRTDTLVRSSICSETIQLSIVVDDRDTRAPIRSRNQPRTLEPRSERIDETTVGTVSSAVPIASVWSTASGAIQSGAVTTSASTFPGSASEGTIDPFVRIIRSQEQLKLSRSTSESFVSANASQVNNA